MNIAIILAGGEGTRAGLPVPKQFYEVLGRPVIAYTIDAFENHPEVDAIEVVCRDGYQQTMDALIAREGYQKICQIVAGGATFQDSVIEGLEALKVRALDDDIVLVHYGVSPFVTDDIISDAIAVCKEKGNASPASPQVYLTAKKNDGVSTREFIDRDEMVCLNAPQALRYGYAMRLYEEGRKMGLLETVDPHTASLMLAMGEPIWFSKNSSTNIKITTSDDVRLFKGWLLTKEEEFRIDR